MKSSHEGLIPEGQEAKKKRLVKKFPKTPSILKNFQLEEGSNVLKGIVENTEASTEAKQEIIDEILKKISNKYLRLFKSHKEKPSLQTLQERFAKYAEFYTGLAETQENVGEDAKLLTPIVEKIISILNDLQTLINGAEKVKPEVSETSQEKLEGGEAQVLDLITEKPEKEKVIDPVVEATTKDEKVDAPDMEQDASIEVPKHFATKLQHAVQNLVWDISIFNEASLKEEEVEDYNMQLDNIEELANSAVKNIKKEKDIAEKLHKISIVKNIFEKFNEDLKKSSEGKNKDLVHSIITTFEHYINMFKVFKAENSNEQQGNNTKPEQVPTETINDVIKKIISDTVLSPYDTKNDNEVVLNRQDLENLYTVTDKELTSIRDEQDTSVRLKRLADLKNIFTSQIKVIEEEKSLNQSTKEELIHQLDTYIKHITDRETFLQEKYSKGDEGENKNDSKKEEVQSVDHMVEVTAFLNDLSHTNIEKEINVESLSSEILHILEEEEKKLIVRRDGSVKKFYRYIETLLEIISTIEHNKKEPKKRRLINLLTEKLNRMLPAQKNLEQLADQDIPQDAPREGRHEVFVSKKKIKEVVAKKKLVDMVGGNTINTTQPNIEGGLNDMTEKKVPTQAAREPFTDFTERTRKVPFVPQENQPKASIDTMVAEILIQQDDSEMIMDRKITENRSFNGWLERIAQKNHETTWGQAKTLEDWYTEYEKQQGKIELVKNILKDKKVNDVIFEKFATPDEKTFAQKEMIEKLEWDLITNKTETEQRISQIEALKKTCDEQKAAIQKLEQEKAAIDKSLKNTDLRISGELVFNIIYGQKAEQEKLFDFRSFLNDMSENYMFYHGKIKEKEDAGDMRKMFMLYNETRTNTPYENRIVGLNWWQRQVGKINRFRHGGDYDRNYEDMRAFEATINTFKVAKLLPSETVNKDEANHNMDRLESFVNLAEEAVSTGVYKTIEEFVAAQDDTHEGKKLFTAVFDTYIKNKGKRSSMQKRARQSNNHNAVFASIDRRIADSQSDAQENTTQMVSTMQGDSKEFEEFIKKAKSEFLLDDLNSIINKLRNTKGADSKELQILEEKLKNPEYTNDSSDELLITHKRASLELAQAYIRLAALKKESDIAPKGMAYYKMIFESSDQEIPKAKKKEYADTMLGLLKTRLTTKPTTLQKLQIEKLIKYFEDIKKSL